VNGNGRGTGSDGGGDGGGQGSDRGRIRVCRVLEAGLVIVLRLA
jgi:hypothetical protein